MNNTTEQPSCKLTDRNDWLSTARSCASFVAQHLANGDEARIRDRLLGARSHPSVDFAAVGLITAALQTHSPPDVRDRSPQRPHALALAEGRPHPHARPRMRRRGARRAARGRRTRSSAWKPNCDAPGASAHESFTRSGAAFSSESRPRQTSSGTGSPHEARGVLPHWAMTRGRRVKGAPGDGVGAEALETPAPWGVSRRLVPRRRRTVFSTVASASGPTSFA